MRIAVIGGGPSGLFFCHAIEKIQRETGKQISVTCFEKATQPGGVWRASTDTEGTEMYEALWTNGSSHCTEFHDYTYDEHFKKPVTVYLRRQDLLEYLLGRCSNTCKDFFDKYVKCNHAVRNVVYDDSASQFEVSYESEGVSTTETFDKCVWACGENGKRNMPKQLMRIFQTFKGTVLHSSETSNMEEHMKDKNILIVGGGYSAEDLSLQAIKLGVKHVYVSSRDPEAEISYTDKWPDDKVTKVLNQVPCGVTEDGKCIQFHEVSWTPHGYKVDSDEIETELRDIDTVFLCTGYHVDLDMLDENLRYAGFPKFGHKIAETLDIPENWKMPENEIGSLTGEVPPAEKVRYIPDYVNPNFYKGILISNPNMMFLSTYGSYTPLMACDVYANLLAKYSTGVLEMPSVDEMKRRNHEYMLKLMGMPYFRYLMDDNFWKAVEKLPNFWPQDGGGNPSEWEEAEDEEYVESFRRLTGDMHEGEYPVSYGTTEELNAHGKAMYDFGMFDYYNRADLQPKGEEKSWLTFRDVQKTARYYSMFTGTKAVPLKQHWVDIEVDTGKENVVSPRNDSS